MKQLLKSIFNLTTILQCYISAIGYGLGYAIGEKFNMHPILCLILCLALGMVFDRLANIILNSKVYKYSKRRKILLSIALYLVYLVAWLIGDYYFDHDIDTGFFFNIGFIILFQIFAFVLKFIKGYIKNKKTK